MAHARAAQNIPAVGEVMTPFPYAIEVDRNRAQDPAHLVDIVCDRSIRSLAEHDDLAGNVDAEVAREPAADHDPFGIF